MKVKYSEMINEAKKIIGEEQFNQRRFTEADIFKLLQERGIEVILDKYKDYEMYYSGEHYGSSSLNYKPRYTSTSDFILVHKTHFVPQNGVIEPSKDFRKISGYFNIKNKSYEVNYPVQRKTVHTCVNGEVTSHTYGNWDNCEYIILIPFDDVPRENIASANTVDTYTNGSIQLTSRSWIICPEVEVEKVKEMNPGINVIGYSGDKALGAGDTLVSLLGYYFESSGMRNWHNTNSEKDFTNIMKQENIKTGLHGGSKEYMQETGDQNVAFCVECCKFLRDNEFTADDIKHCFFPEKEGYSKSAFIEYPFGNIELFSRLMAEEGFTMSPEFIKIFEMIPIGLHIQSDEYSQSIKLKSPLLLPENISEERKKMLEPIIEKINEANENNRFDDRNKSLEELSSIMLCETVMSAKGMEIKHPYTKESSNKEDTYLAIESCVETCKAIKSATDNPNEILTYVDQLINCQSVLKDMDSFSQKMKEEGFNIPLEYVGFFDRLKGVYGYKYVKLEKPLKVPENIDASEQEIFKKICEVINNGEYEKRDELIKEMFTTMTYSSIMRSKTIDLNNKIEEEQEISESMKKFHKINNNVQPEETIEQLQELKQEVDDIDQEDNEIIGFRR